MAEEQDARSLRLAQIAAMREGGQNPYPNGFTPDVTSPVFRHDYERYSREELAQGHYGPVRLAGRIMSYRSNFATLRDRAGDIQLFAAKTLDEQSMALYKSLGVGDIVGISGVPFKTQTGELSVKLQQVQLLNRAVRQLPEKFHGLQDKELRYRMRYVDLIMNEKTRSTFYIRNQVIRCLRHFLDQREFVEVETPMMHPLVSGATAKPFVTYHNQLDMQLFMRVAPELYLKRLVVGGLDRVYEINRNFRNEGVDHYHNPEFTMIEFYQAYATYTDLMDLTEELLMQVAKSVTGGGTRLPYQGHDIDYGQRPYPRITLTDSLLAFVSKDVLHDRDRLLAWAAERGVAPAADWDHGKLLLKCFEHVVEPTLVQPTFITDFPTAVSPLSRPKDDNPLQVERFELYVAGFELANAFSELNDPVDQKERFRAQVAEKAAGDDEACDMDEDYIRALEYGLPPTAGEGIGIDRLVMLMTDQESIRDVILFPHMRPE